MITLCREDLLDLLRRAESEGAATAIRDFELEQADRAAEDEEGRIDSLRALDEDGTGQDREGLYVAGCGEYDTVDYRGRPLRPQFNDVGEQMW